MEKKYEANPLVIGVVHAFRSWFILAHTRVRNVISDGFLPRVRKRDGGMNPAECVDYLPQYVRNRVTVDRIADVLCGSENSAKQNENTHGNTTVETEHVIVDDGEMCLGEGF